MTFCFYLKGFVYYMAGAVLICSASIPLLSLNDAYCYYWSNYRNREAIRATAAFGIINSIFYMAGAIYANRSNEKPIETKKEINFYGYDPIPGIDDKNNKNSVNYI